MKSYFSKPAIIGLVKRCRPNTNNQKQWIKICQIIICLLVLCLFATYLNKIYEVPVNYTEVHIEREGELKTEDLHFSLIRDYDRNKESTKDVYEKVKEDRAKAFKNGNKDQEKKTIERRGGVFLEGTVHQFDSAHYSSFIGPDSLLLKRENRIKEILDTAHYQRLNNVVYVLIKGTGRQILKYENYEFEESYEWTNSVWESNTNYYKYGTFKKSKINNKYLDKSTWNIPIDTMLCYRNLKTSNHGFSREAFLFSPTGSEVMPVFVEVTGSNFEKPNPLFIAEDISKMVEIIRLNLRTAQMINSITIDYCCPTEFDFINPEPDERTMSSIRYTDRMKLSQIARNGLEYHVRFPDMDNVQEMRIFFLTTVVTLLITFILSLLYDLFSNKLLNIWHNHPYRCIISIALLAIVIFTYLYLFNEYTNVDYHELNFETYDLGNEWGD